MVFADEKVEAAIRMLRAKGHVVEPREHGGKDEFWYEIDRRMLASREEMQNLADGVYSLAELEELYRRRRGEKADEDPDEAAEEVLNISSKFYEVHHFDRLTPQFKDLDNKALKYQNAKRNADIRRDGFQLVKQSIDTPKLDALLEQAVSLERETREIFVKAYKDFWRSVRLSGSEL